MPPHLILFGLVVMIALVVAFLLQPAFFLAVLVVAIGALLLILYHGEPHALGAGIFLIVIGVALGFVAQGHALSLELVHR